MIEFGPRIDGVSYVERLCAYAVTPDASNAIAVVSQPCPNPVTLFLRNRYFPPGPRRV